MFAFLALFLSAVSPTEIQTFIVQFTLGQATTPPTFEVPDLIFPQIPIAQIISQDRHYALQTTPTLSIQATGDWTLLAQFQNPHQDATALTQSRLTLSSEQFNTELQPDQWQPIWQGRGPQTTQLNVATNIFIPRQIHITAGNYRSVLTWQLQQVPAP